MSKEPRIFARAQAEFPAHLTTRSGELEATVYNLSLGGVLVRTEPSPHLTVGARVEVWFQPDAQGPEILADASVQWIRPLTTTVQEVGLEFNILRDSDLTRLQTFITAQSSR